MFYKNSLSVLLYMQKCVLHLLVAQLNPFQLVSRSIICSAADISVIRSHRLVPCNDYLKRNVSCRNIKMTANRLTLAVCMSFVKSKYGITTFFLVNVAQMTHKCLSFQKPYVPAIDPTNSVLCQHLEVRRVPFSLQGCHKSLCSMHSRLGTERHSPEARRAPMAGVWRQRSHRRTCAESTRAVQPEHRPGHDAFLVGAYA